MPKDLKITVTEPEKAGDGLSSYVHYKVTTQTTRQRFSQQETFVRRRYNDFLWLRTNLEETYPFCVIPPMPEKNPVTKKDSDFIEKRRIGLQTFLVRISDHPTLSNADFFVDFLQSTNWEMTTKKKRLFHGIGSATTKAKDVLQRSTLRNPEERFVDAATYINQFQESVHLVVGVNDKVQKELDEHSAAMAELSPAFALLANSETDIADACNRLSQDFEKLSTGVSNVVKARYVRWCAPFHEYMLYSKCVLDTLKHRDAQQLHTESLLQELETCRIEKKQAEAGVTKANLNTMLGSKTPEQARQQRIFELGARITVLEQETEQNQKTLKAANKQVAEELQKWNARKKFDMKKAFVGYADAMAKHSSQAKELWQEAIPVMESIKAVE